MERLDGLLTALAVALAVVCATAVHALEETLGLPLGAQLVTEAVVIVLALTVLQEVLATTLLEARWLRRRLLGSRYVEGTWVDVVFYPDRDPRIGIVYIGSHGTGLTYQGENLDLEGRYVDSFRTEGLKVDFPQVLFQYREDVGSSAPFLAGVGALSFELRNGVPIRYTGYCLDAVEKVGHTLIGRRVDDAEDISRLEDPATRAATALALATPLLDQAPSPGGS